MYTLMHTGQPFSVVIPDEAFLPLSRHKTLSAAYKRMRKELSDMQRYCGGSGWSDHFRISSDDGRIYTRSDMHDFFIRVAGDREYNHLR